MNQQDNVLADSELRYRRLFETAQDAILILDGDTGEITDANPFINDLLGYTLEEMVGKNLWDIGELKDVLASKLSYDELQKHNYVRYDHLPLLTKDERDIAVEVVANAYMVGQKRVIQCNIRDVTERNQLAEAQQIAAKLEAVGTLAGGIAHDFNNLLTGILGNISVAKRYIEPKGEAYERLEEAEKAVLNAQDLSLQLLTFSRGGIPNKTVFSVGKLLRRSASFALRGSKVKPEFSLPDELWAIEADEGQINQVISNIVINAEQAMPNGKVINIEAKNSIIGGTRVLPLPAGHYVEIAIKDRGVGIPAEHLTRIFDPFFTTKQKGSGLGLSSAYSIIKSHDGYITAESELGVGTTFYIFLPATTKPAPEELAATDTILYGTGKILIMDDQETIRETLSRMLTLAGYEVELTKDGNEAIETYVRAKAIRKPFDAVIMDLTIPGGTGGKEAIARLLAIDHNARVIASSGYATDPIMSDYKKYGFSAAVPKPYTARAIEKALHDVLKKK